MFESRRARHLFRHPSGRSRQFSNKNEAFEPWLGSIDKLAEPRKSGYFEQSYGSRSLKRTEATGNRSLLCLIFCPKNTSRCFFDLEKAEFYTQTVVALATLKLPTAATWVSYTSKTVSSLVTCMTS